MMQQQCLIALNVHVALVEEVEVSVILASKVNTATSLAKLCASDATQRIEQLQRTARVVDLDDIAHLLAIARIVQQDITQTGLIFLDA